MNDDVDLEASGMDNSTNISNATNTSANRANKAIVSHAKINA